MITVQSISKYDKLQNTVITIGTFDGVHIGHRKILERLINSAKSSGMRATVLTFFPHPRMVLQKDAGLKLLNTVEEKAAIMEQIGLDCLIVHPFTKAFSRLTATDFVRDILVNQLKAKKIIIGYDHRFGRNRNANIQDLMAFGNILDFEVEEIPAQEIDEVSVSSTKIRKALEIGDLTVAKKYLGRDYSISGLVTKGSPAAFGVTRERVSRSLRELGTANRYLGYPYMLTGTIKKGKGLGRTLSFPTANLHIAEDYKLIPKNGVYVIQSNLNGAPVNGMMNIGVNPTVDGSRRSIEIHFFDFEDNLYGKKVQIEILHRLRDEKRFDSVEDLRKQLEKDKIKALSLIS